MYCVPRILIYIVLVFALLGMNTACAASFDCAKASTKVEKMICKDAELSKLDDELGKDYSEARTKASDPETLKKQQRAWLKMRNSCADTQCLKGKYSERIKVLQQVSTVELTEKKRHSVSSLKQRQKYPPYPEVWHRIIPIKKSLSKTYDFFQMKNGDYRIAYLTGGNPKLNWRDPHSFEYGGVSFFGGDVLEHIDRSDVSWSLPNYVPDKLSLTLPNKSKISLIDHLDYRAPRRCPQTLNHYARIDYSDGRVEKRSLLYLLDEPRTAKIQKRCASTNELSFQEKVVSLQGSYIPLDDGGFLLSEEFEGLVIRFDANFQTKSDLLGKKLFIVDLEELQKKTGIPFDMNSYQQSQDDAVKMIERMKREGVR